MIQQYNAIQQARRSICDLSSPESKQDYRLFSKTYKTAEEALSRLRETLTKEREHLCTNKGYLLTLIHNGTTSNESGNLTSRLNKVRGDQMVNDELLAALNKADANIQEHYEEGVAAYGSLRRAKRKQPLAFVAGGLTGIVLAASITGAALVHHYESRPAPPPKVETRIETRYVDSAAPIPKNLEEHLEGIKFGIGEPLVIIDPARQEERVYVVELFEQMRHPISTGKKVGPKTARGDGKTPEVPPGEYFEVTMVEPSTTWKRHGRYAFGPWFARIDTPNRKLAKWGLTKKGSSIGLHGTDEPDYLGTRRSEGCIRHADEVIVQMKDEGFLEEGTKVVINTDILGGI